MKSDRGVKTEIIVYLPAKRPGGHEIMSMKWIVAALSVFPDVTCNVFTEAGLRERIGSIAHRGLKWTVMPDIYGRREWQISLRDALRLRACAARISRSAPILLAPGAIQSQWWNIFMALVLGREVYVYVPLAFRSKDMGFRWHRLKDALALLASRFVRGWITVSVEQAGLLRDVWRVPGQIRIIPNYCDRSTDRRLRPTRDVTREPVGRLRVLFLGRFEPYQKGLDWLVTALRRADAEMVSSIEFTFQGEGSYQSALEEIRDQLGENTIRLRCWGSASDALGESDVLLLASRYEGLPLVAVEAICSGVVPVVSDRSGLSGLVPEGSMFKFGDEAGLWRSLARARSVQVRQEWLEFSRNAIEQYLSEDVFREAIDSAVQMITETPQSNPC